MEQKLKFQCIPMLQVKRRQSSRQKEFNDLVPKYCWNPLYIGLIAYILGLLGLICVCFNHYRIKFHTSTQMYLLLDSYGSCVNFSAHSFPVPFLYAGVGICWKCLCILIAFQKLCHITVTLIFHVVLALELFALWAWYVPEALAEEQYDKYCYLRYHTV